MEIQWSLVLFTALTGAAGWMYACIAADQFLKKASNKVNFSAGVCALVVLIVGGLASVTHLSHPENILGALSHPTSGIFVEAVLVGITALFGILYLVFAKREGSEAIAKVMVIIAAVFGVVLSFMAGESYMMAAQTTWNTFLLPLGYLGTAIPAGVAGYMSTAITVDKETELTQYAKFLSVGSIIAIVTAVAYAVVSGAFVNSVLNAVAAVACAGVVPFAIAAVLSKGAAEAKAEDKAEDKAEEAADEKADDKAEEAAEDKAESKAGNKNTLITVAFVCAILGALCYRCMMWDVASPLANFFGML